MFAAALVARLRRPRRPLPPPRRRLPPPDDDASRGCGWFDSSADLRAGLVVVELALEAPDAAPPRPALGWPLRV